MTIDGYAPTLYDEKLMDKLALKAKNKFDPTVIYSDKEIKKSYFRAAKGLALG
jgi:hypothetical protein